MNQSEITSFIRHKLPRKLLADLHALKIVKEADIECSAYFHLRKFLGERTDWRVLARKHAPATGHFIDLLLFQNDIPAIAIELKWAKKTIGDKDRASLEKALDDLKVQKAYWISMTLGENLEGKPERNDGDQYRLFQIVIPLGLKGQPRADWITRRKIFRQEMKEGKNG
jgi:hypothetical protein